MPSSNFSQTTRVRATPSVIWAALQDAQTWIGLGVVDTVTGAVIENRRLMSFDWTTAAAGTQHHGKATTVEAVPGERMVLALESAEIVAEITITLSPDGGEASMTVSIAARSRGFLAGMFWGVVSDALRRGLTSHVDEFAAGFG